MFTGMFILQLTESVAYARDIFQGEEYMYRGLYSPTIMKLTEKIESINDLKHCQILQKAISKSIHATQSIHVTSLFII